jgi:RecJ-like exonuclease
MNTLKLGEVRVERVHIPHCSVCKTYARSGQRRYFPSECLCAGTGRYLECDSCSREFVGDQESCYEVSTAIRPRYDRELKEWITDRSLHVCRECLGGTIADTLPELNRDYDHAPELAS